MNAELQYRVEQLCYQLSAHCDNKDWDAYLAMFSDDSEFHLPQWDSEHVYTTDPKKGMSLIYYPNRGGLEDRVFRLRTGKAASATPLPRTLHLISNVRLQALPDGELQATVNWHTLYHRLQISEQFFGYATYTLRPAADSWKISRKHAVLLNDTINSVLDFYHL